ncbi:MAG TPA: Xaa-Pro peptidase family protein [bacterium]
MQTAKLIIADSERSANLYYGTRFLAPDPFIFLQCNGRRMLLMSDLEVDRARAQAKVDEVRPTSGVADALKRQGKQEPGFLDILDAVLKEQAISRLEVPGDFGVSHADGLRAKGYAVEPVSEPFFPGRVVKTGEEIAAITETLRVTEGALACAVDLIANSRIEPDGTLELGGKPLTAELVRTAMHLTMMERGCVAQHTIVAGGLQAVDPHQEGAGPLRANEPIVIDVFPQHARTRYFADLTRTVVKGQASDKVRRMFDAVRAGQEIAFRMIRDGVDGADVHRAILDSFEALGFPTGELHGRMQGFFHGTGHGVGLEIHEPPRIGPRADRLRTGMVVTVEPGLYYTDAGGMRIEDMVVVTSDGCRVLSQAPKTLEV